VEGKDVEFLEGRNRSRGALDVRKRDLNYYSSVNQNFG
jgi:hypothetical protein